MHPVIASAAKQSSAELMREPALDCFAALAMTGFIMAKPSGMTIN
jgi:hypothetical protein